MLIEPCLACLDTRMLSLRQIAAYKAWNTIRERKSITEKLTPAQIRAKKAWVTRKSKQTIR